MMSIVRLVKYKYFTHDQFYGRKACEMCRVKDWVALLSQGAVSTAFNCLNQDMDNRLTRVLLWLRR